MARIFRFTQGGNTLLDIQSTNIFKLHDGWRPAVAQRRRSAVAGRSHYENVVEKIPLQVSTDTADEMTSNVEKLAALMDRVEHWRIHGGDPVVWEYRSENSTHTDPLRTILTRAPSPLALPSNWLQRAETSSKAAVDITLTFERRGSWLDVEEAVTISTSANNLYIALPTPFAVDVSNYSPVQLELTFTGAPAGGVTGYFLSAGGNDAGTLRFYNSFTSADADATLTNDSGNMPGNNYYSITATPVASYIKFYRDLSGSNELPYSPIYDLFIMVRNQSATIGYNVYCNGADANPQDSPPVGYIAPAASADAGTGKWTIQRIPFQPHVAPVNIAGLYVSLEPVGSGSGALHVGAFGVMGRTPDTNVTAINTGPTSTATAVRVKHEALDGVGPIIDLYDDGAGQITSYASEWSGQAFIEQRGGSLTTLPILIPSDGSSGVVSATWGVGMVARRRRAYLIPK